MVGIVNIKKAVKFGIDFANQAIKALQDKKISFLEALGFIDELSQLPGVIESGKDIVSEINDLSPEERKELHDYVTMELDIPAEKVEKVIADSVDAIISIYTLIDGIRKLKTP